MTDLVALVLQYVTDHPLTNTIRVQQEIRKPVQEIEHALGRLKREGKIYQPKPGEWLVKGARPAAPKEEAPMPQTRPSRPKTPEHLPKGKKRCPACKDVKDRDEFYGSGYCRPCGIAKSSEYNTVAKQKAKPAKTIEDVRRRLVQTPVLVSPTPVVAVLKRLLASIEEEIAKLEKAA